MRPQGEKGTRRETCNGPMHALPVGFLTCPHSQMLVPDFTPVCRLYFLLCYLGSQRTVSQLTRSCRSRVCLDFIHFSLLAGIQMGEQSAQRIAPLNVATKSADHYGARS